MNERQDGLGPEGSYYQAKEKAEAQAKKSQMDSVYPVFITGLFLVLGFVFNLWHPAWLLFLTIPLQYIKADNAMERWCNPVMITLIYLVLGFFFGLWHPGWLIFLAIPVSAMVQKKQS